MKSYKRRPGVVLLEVCGESLLVSTGEARGQCPYVTHINAAAARFWTLLESEMSVQELTRAAAQEQGAEEKAVLLPALAFLSKMEKSGYVIAEEMP